MNAHSPRPILRVEGLVKAFESRRGGRPPRAVDDVSFSVAPGQALGLVGESGSGKTTIARCLFGLEVPDRGVVDLDGTRIVQDRTLLITKQTRRRMQMVFQDPFSSLNPTFTIGATVREGLLTHGLAGSRAEADRRVGELLDAVGLDASHRTRLPRELSGGQCQRAGIARALAVQPDLLVCDEPVSALDVSVRAQIINLFIELKAALGLSLLFIGHDLSIIQRLCEDLVILRNGRVVESGSRANVFANATDAYTRALIAATPVPDPRRERRRRQARRQAEAEVARVGDRL